MSHLRVFPLLTAQEIANSPTTKEGWTAAKEKSVRSRAVKVIIRTAEEHKYKMSSSTAGIGVTLFVRYYTLKSMQKNHPFLIALASLFLAGKLNDDYRSLESIIYYMLMTWYGEDQPDVIAKLRDREFLDRLHSTTLESEIAILTTLGFDLNVEALPRVTWRIVKNTPALKVLETDESLLRVVILCNNVMKLDPTLILQYSMENIGLAVLQFYFTVSKGKIQQPPNNSESGAVWHEELGLSADMWKELSARLGAMYEPATAQRETAATTTASGMSGGGGGGSKQQDAMRSTVPSMMMMGMSAMTRTSSISSITEKSGDGGGGLPTSDQRRHSSHHHQHGRHHDQHRYRHGAQSEKERIHAAKRPRNESYNVDARNEEKKDSDSELEEGEIEEGELPPEN